MRPDIPCLIVDVTDTIDALHFVLVEAVSTQDMRIIVPVRGNFVDCKESFCTVSDGVGKLVKTLFCEVGAGMETGVYVVDGMNVRETIVGISFEVTEMLFEEFHAGHEFGREGRPGSFIVPRPSQDTSRDRIIPIVKF